MGSNPYGFWSLHIRLYTVYTHHYKTDAYTPEREREGETREKNVERETQISERAQV